MATTDKPADQRVLLGDVAQAVRQAGLSDLSAITPADLETLMFNDSGQVVGADALIATLRRTKPHLFRYAKDMTPDEYQAARRQAVRGATFDQAARDARDLANVTKRYQSNPPTPKGQK